MGWSPPHRRMKEKPGRYPAYLEWLRERPCHLADHGGCGGDVVPAHTPDKATNGMGKKVDDSMAIPMCCAHHMLQHNIGWASFADRFSFNPRLVAAQYFQGWQYG